MWGRGGVVGREGCEGGVGIVERVTGGCGKGGEGRGVVGRVARGCGEGKGVLQLLGGWQEVVGIVGRTARGVGKTKGAGVVGRVAGGCVEGDEGRLGLGEGL